MSTGVQQSNPSAEFPYTKSVYKAIVDAIGPDYVLEKELTFNDEGVWVTPPVVPGVGWHPLCEVVAHGGPNPLDEPWLRFPFNAGELAALLLDGWGDFIRDFYGEWEDGPNEDALGHIGARGHLAREALVAAYEECRKAIALAPKLDTSLEQKKNVLSEQCRRAESEACEREKVSEPGISREEWGERRGRAKQSIRDLDQQFWVADQAADDARSQWRAAVVQHLLLPVHKVPDEAFESEQLRALPADRREEALWQQLQFSDFQDSEERRAHWALIIEGRAVESELRRWHALVPASVTEKGLHDTKVKDLEGRLADVKHRIDNTGKATKAHADGNEASRQRRRLQSLRQDFGGDWICRNGKWGAKDRQTGAFGKLVQQERSNGSKYFSDKSVRADLSAAAEAEAAERRTGRMWPGALANP